MKKVCSIIFFIGCIHYVKAQNDSVPVIAKTAKHENDIFFNTGYSFGSNAMTNGLLSTYLENGFITDGMKAQVNSNLKSMNRLGGDVNTSVGCKIHCDTLLGIKECILYD